MIEVKLNNREAKCLMEYLDSMLTCGIENCETEVLLDRVLKKVADKVNNLEG